MKNFINLWFYSIIKMCHGTFYTLIKIWNYSFVVLMKWQLPHFMLLRIKKNSEMQCDGMLILPPGQSRASSSSRPAGAASSERRARRPAMSAPRARAAPPHHPPDPRHSRHQRHRPPLPYAAHPSIPFRRIRSASNLILLWFS